MPSSICYELAANGGCFHTSSPYGGRCTTTFGPGRTTAYGRVCSEPSTKKLERKPGGYARNLLAGDDEVSVWAIAWSPGSATSIHDHHCSCCFGVVSGTDTETWFRYIGQSRAVPAEVQERTPG